MYSRSTAETTMNPIGQNIPVIYLHLEDTTNMIDAGCFSWTRTVYEKAGKSLHLDGCMLTRMMNMETVENEI